jgi:hypothetical protein
MVLSHDDCFYINRDNSMYYGWKSAAGKSSNPWSKRLMRGAAV